ncbi:MAG: hypothetical protein CM1200mP30_01550 [Pseudomonadota bacterium]|nr:MAG: hypothetical protein CM1200mP30_01550 [Pseudomonadota bacterium]
MLTRRDFFNRISAPVYLFSLLGHFSPFLSGDGQIGIGKAFHSRQYQKALESLFGSKVLEKTSNIKIQTPDVAENGASVPITVSTSIKEVETLSIFIENNPLPLIASYNLKQYAIPNFSVRVKIAKSSPIHVVVKPRGKKLLSS